MKFLKNIEIKGRKFLVKMLTSNITAKKINISKLNSNTIKKVVIVRIDERLGNLIFINPIINSFLKHKKDVTIIIPKKFSELFQLNSNFGKFNIIYFDKKRLFNPVNLIKLIYTLKKHRYDLMFDATNPNNLSTLSLFIMLLINAKLKIGFIRKNSESLLNIPVKLPIKRTHILNYYEKLFKVLKIKFYPELKFKIPSQYNDIRRKIKQKYKNKYLIGVHPGGRGLKQFPPEKLKAVLEKIIFKFKNIHIFLFIGPNEKNIMDIFFSLGNKLTILTPQNIIELSIYMSILNLYIGNDAGPIHLAEGFNIKFLGIYKPDAAVIFKPIVTDYRMIITDSPYDLSVQKVFSNFIKIYKN